LEQYFISSSVVTLCLSSTVHIIWNLPSVCVVFHPLPCFRMTQVLCRSIAFSHALTYSMLETTHNWVSHIPVQVRWLYFSWLTLPNWAYISLCLGKWLKIPSEVFTVIFVEQSSLTWDCCQSESHKRLRCVWKHCLMVHVQCAAYLCHDLGFEISLIQCVIFEWILSSWDTKSRWVWSLYVSVGCHSTDGSSRVWPLGENIQSCCVVSVYLYLRAGTELLYNDSMWL